MAVEKMPVWVTVGCGRIKRESRITCIDRFITGDKRDEGNGRLREREREGGVARVDRMIDRGW